MDLGFFIVDKAIDMKFEDGDFAGDDTLETAIVISLFTDQRVPRQDLPDGEISRRGWWGDMFPDVEGDQIGSLLWTLARKKQNNEIRALTETEAKKALQWMIDDGIVKSVSVEMGYFRQGFDTIKISLTRPDNEENSFAFQWNATEVRRAA